jgi:protoporphyrinogen oxidase
MVPYNEKLWRTDLNLISSDWVDWSIPVPTLEEVVGGALGITNDPETDYNQREVIDDALRSLKRCGMLKGSDRILVEAVIDIPYAYVIYDDFRKKNVPSIMNFLKSNGIWSIGRYGSGKYMSMEDTILEGKAAAEELRG